MCERSGVRFVKIYSVQCLSGRVLAVFLFLGHFGAGCSNLDISDAGTN